MGPRYPERTVRILARTRELRNGQDCDSDVATRIKGGGLLAHLVRERFEKARVGLSLKWQRVELDSHDLGRPSQTLLF